MMSADTVAAVPGKIVTAEPTGPPDIGQNPTSALPDTGTMQKQQQLFKMPDPVAEPTHVADPTPQPQATPPPPPVQKAAPANPDILALEEKLSRMEGAMKQNELRARIQWVRDRGLDALNNDEIAKLLPNADPNTTEGRMNLDKWKADHPALFKDSQIPNQTFAPDFMEGLKPTGLWAKNGLLQDFFEKSLGD